MAVRKRSDGSWTLCVSSLLSRPARFLTPNQLCWIKTAVSSRLASLSPLPSVREREGRGGARSHAPPDEVIMWKQSVLNPPLTPATPLCYTTPDNERYTEGQSSSGQHFLWLWLHWSWFTVILRYESRYKMSDPAAAARAHWELVGRTQSGEGNLLWNRNNANVVLTFDCILS